MMKNDKKVDVLTSFFTHHKKTKKVRGKKEAYSTYACKYYIAYSTSFVAGQRRPESTEFLDEFFPLNVGINSKTGRAT